MRILKARPPVLLLTCLAWALSGVTVVAAGPAPAVPAMPSTEEPQIVRIGVTENGFDRNDLQVQLQQGRPVELKFEYEQSYLDSHVFELQGYDLRSEKLSSSRPEVSIKFVPMQAGPVIFYCTTACEVHRALQGATLEVVAPAAGQAAGSVQTPTSLTMASARNVTNGEPVELLAALHDSSHKPVAGAQISFYVATELFPQRPMLAGSAATDPQGQARLVYVPRSNGEMTVRARFEGGGAYTTSDASYSLQVANARPAYIETARGLEIIGRWAPTVVVLVLTAIWGTYALVVLQIVWIARSRGGTA